MPVISIETYIRAPISLCFDLARNVDIHTKTTFKTKEHAVGGVINGLLEPGDTVTWQAVHFGIKQKLTAKVTEMNRPFDFTDIQVKGAFQSFTHLHQFSSKDEGTVMIDRFEYKAPFGFFGMLADWLFLRRYMHRFLTQRAWQLKRIAEDKAYGDYEVWE
ncbi:hypothetical protein ACFOZY_01595 [Chungangia koreensis]|uniref:Cell division protein n=1 Tax=Chungangia koreensis TaxID=752657 RepID=A0ABV8X3A9_9LACT